MSNQHTREKHTLQNVTFCYDKNEVEYLSDLRKCTFHTVHTADPSPANSHDTDSKMLIFCLWNELAVKEQFTHPTD